MEALTENQVVPQTKSKNVVGKILIGASAAVAIGISVVCFPFVSPALRKFTLPFIPGF
jgi:hypothetical protein